MELLKEKEHVGLAVDEAAFIALHIVNAEMDGNMKQTFGMSGMRKDMLHIVQYMFQMELGHLESIAAAPDGDGKDRPITSAVSNVLSGGFAAVAGFSPVLPGILTGGLWMVEKGIGWDDKKEASMTIIGSTI